MVTEGAKSDHHCLASVLHLSQNEKMIDHGTMVIVARELLCIHPLVVQKGIKASPSKTPSIKESINTPSSENFKNQNRNEDV